MSGAGAAVVGEAEVTRFCRNAAHLWALRDPSSLADEITALSPDRLTAALESSPSHTAWYLALRATEKFYCEKDRYPGTNGIPVELDQMDLRKRVDGIMAALHLPKTSSSAVSDDYVGEMCRYGASEVSSVGAWVGGAAAQEAVKLLTRQYVPLHNTLLFDAFTQSAATLTL